MAPDRSKPHMKLASPGLVFAAVQNRLLAPAPARPGTPGWDLDRKNTALSHREVVKHRF